MDYSDRLQAALAHAGKTRKQLHLEANVTVQAIGQVINRKSKGFSVENNSRVARALGVSSDWLATGIGSMTNEGASLVAHPVSLQLFDHPILTREQLMRMDAEAPARFIYVLEDDSMGQFGRTGTEVLFYGGEMARSARVGAGVLVKDKSGQLYVRRKAQGSHPGHWLAIPAVGGGLYRTLDSEVDGLLVLGVWRGVVNKGLEDA